MRTAWTWQDVAVRRKQQSRVSELTTNLATALALARLVKPGLVAGARGLAASEGTTRTGPGRSGVGSAAGSSSGTAAGVLTAAGVATARFVRHEPESPSSAPDVPAPPS